MYYFSLSASIMENKMKYYGNGRYYSKGLWDREMDKYSELIEQRSSMGELDHHGKSKKQIESSNKGCFFSGIGLLLIVIYLIIDKTL